MATPQSVLHVPRPLRDYVIAYRPDQAGYLATRLLPVRPVDHRADQIRQENKGNLLRKADLRIGSNGRLREAQFKMDASTSYVTEPYGLEVFLFRHEMADADSELTYEQRQTDHGLIWHYTNMEYSVVNDVLRTAGNWGSNTAALALGSGYDIHTSGVSNPVEDGLQICDRIEMDTGHRPNTIAMSRQVWTQISTHPAWLARSETQQGGLGIITKEMAEKVWDVPPGTIQVSGATYNLAQEGSTDKFRSFLGPDMLFAYNEPGKINTFGLGSMFSFSGASGAGAGLREQGGGSNEGPGAYISLRAYDAPWQGKDGAIVLKFTGEWVPKILNNKAGYLLRNVVDYSNTSIFGDFLLPT